MFSHLIKSQRVPHTLLLTGQNSERLEEEAQKLAHQLSAAPDIYEYRPEGKLALHSIDKMRELKEEVYLPPYQHACKVFIIYDVDKMWPQSSNSLLKTFEEPPETSKIILTSRKREKILPTILSRAQTFWVKGASKAHEMDSTILEFLEQKKYGDTRTFFQQIKKIAQFFETFEEPILLQEAFDALLSELEERHPNKRPFLDEARLKLERSTQMTAILESLFIKLGYL